MEIFLYIVLPVIVFAVLAFAFGILLETMAAKLGGQDADPRIEDIGNKLAGANCGGCGYPGCAAFAEALVEGKAQLSACGPTGKQSKTEIAAILGEEVAGDDLMAVVRCNGGHNCETRPYQGYGDCKSANLISGGNKMCKDGCMCLGTCSDACQFYAIKAQNDNGYAEVIYDKCVACGACVRECPKNLIALVPRTAKIYIACSNHDRGKDVSSICKVGCIGCGICAKICPHNAITMDNNLPVIDYTKCTGCLDCVAKCPTKIIKQF